MIRKIIKKIDNKKVIINIPVIDINDYQAVDNSGVGSGIGGLYGPTTTNFINLIDAPKQIISEVFIITEDNNNIFRITEDGLLCRVLE
jgi:hypothetical protein